MKIIRLTESDLHRLVKESVRRILAETDASAAGGGALGGCNLMVGTSDESGGIAYPFGGGRNNKKVGGNPFNQSPIIRRPSPVGEPTNKKEKGVDFSDTLDRKGGKNHSIAMNHVGESVVREAVDESLRNWVVGGMMGLSSLAPMQGNAQNVQNTVPQKNDTVQVDNSRISKDAQQDFSNRAMANMKNTGMSDKDIDIQANMMTNFNIAYRNGKDKSNSQIMNYLSSLTPSKSTKNIHVSKGAENEDIMGLFGNMNRSAAMKCKAFVLPNEIYVVMPINYTLQDVQKELGTFQLGNFDMQ